MTLTEEQMREAATAVGREILLGARRLKKYGCVFPTPNIPMEFYLLDNEYDVAVTVYLKPKLSQREIGEEMLHSGSEPVEKVTE